MVRVLLLAVCGAALCAGQILPPLIGHMRDRVGRVVPVYGVAGTFTLGQPVLDGAREVQFGADGSGVVRTADGWFAFRHGAVSRLDVSTILLTREDTWIQASTTGLCRRVSKIDRGRDEPCPGQPLTLDDFTARLQLPEPVGNFEQMAPDWFVLRGERGLYAVRWTAGADPQMWQLPEAEPEQREDNQ